MWKGSNFTLPSVLIVENDSGDVFIVENKKSKPLVDQILKNEIKLEKSPNSSRKRQEVRTKQREPSPIPVKKEIKTEEDEIIEEYLDEYYNEGHCGLSSVAFIDPNADIDDFQCKMEPTVEIEELKARVQLNTSTTQLPPESTFDGKWSSDEEDDYDDGFPDSDEKPLASNKSLNTSLRRPTKKKSSEGSEKKKTFWSHKMRNLSGKIACKYCDTIFKSKESQSLHECKYLQCDPKNFICRICNKELSKKTFSNHLHETLDCQYCNKKFVNPRNMKTHIEKLHKDEKFIPPQKKTHEDYIKLKEALEEAVNEEPCAKKPKVQYPRKKERFECDLCGKYLVSLRSMSFHMSLHTGDTCYICENCGEKFYTPNGIKGHSCEKKRRRPEKDFRTYDQRYCRFCDSHFANYDENKAHPCIYQHPEDPKCVLCRCCGKVLAKLAFNRHMEIHSGVDWVCGVCDRKLATERALKVHMTTHSGNKPYKCKLCTESFINKVVLDRHMRFHGAATKVYRCEYCFKQLSTETSLKSHVQRLHKTTAQCELCKMEFTSREDLKDHLLTAHEPSVCQVCNKSFTLPRYLKMHEKLHYEDSIARVQCPVCSKLLGMRNIKSHVFRHHPEQFDSWQQSNPKL